MIAELLIGGYHFEPPIFVINKILIPKPRQLCYGAGNAAALLRIKKSLSIVKRQVKSKILS
jgi:hypothetical protein